jgi:NarL family two-component system response regulator LiaR
VPGFEMDNQPDEETIRVVIADGDALARRTLAAALQPTEVSVVAEATTGQEAVALARFYHPDLVILDDDLGGLDAIEVTHMLQQAAPETLVIVLASEPDEAAGLRVLRAGASGYLSKALDPESLPRIVRGVTHGEAAISRQLARALADSYRALQRGGAGLRPVRSPLTDREWEVLDLLASGEGTEDIARTLVLSTETVRSHLKNLYRKLGVRSRVAAVEAAQRLRDRVL